MEDLLALAGKLGETISAHERFKALRAAEKRVSEDETAIKAQSELEEQVNKIRGLEDSGKPIEVADKRELERLQDAFRSNPFLQELVKTQADYFEMMNKVNETIVNQLRPTESESK